MSTVDATAAARWAEFDYLVDALDLPRCLAAPPRRTPTAAGASEKSRAQKEIQTPNAAATAKIRGARRRSPPSCVRMPPPPLPPPPLPPPQRRERRERREELTAAAEFSPVAAPRGRSPESQSPTRDESQSPPSQTQASDLSQCSQYDSQQLLPSGSPILFSQVNPNKISLSFEDSQQPYSASPERPVSSTHHRKRARRLSTRSSGGGAGWLVTADQEERLLSMRTSALGRLGAASASESTSNIATAMKYNTFADGAPASLAHASGAENVLRAVTSEFALRIWEIHKQRTSKAELKNGDHLSMGRFGVATPFVRDLFQQSVSTTRCIKDDDDES
jgi:hypothetical protein